ncbi:hypothetical protein B0H19DRAFT_950337 [Mycena capillaripes]|nr:hypothetical protein B0H19DRAFT_950337 [Mycena capillaripes]
MVGQCQSCGVLESLEHIMLECDAPGQHQVWRLTEIFCKLNWGLILGCGLARFTSPKGKPIPVQSRFFTIIVSTSKSLIWSLRNERVPETHTMASENKIHNRWEIHNRCVSWMNAALNRDRLLSNCARFGSLATRKQLVLNTWSGTLLDEDSLPDDWTIVKGVLGGIRPTTRKNRVG